MKLLTTAICERYSDMNGRNCLPSVCMLPETENTSTLMRSNSNILNETEIFIHIPANSSPRVKGFSSVLQNLS